MRILIRADADGQIGTGHVMRMLALAEHARTRGAQITLASAKLPEALLTRARRQGVEVHLRPDLVPGSAADARHLLRLRGDNADTWIWVDGYPFDDRYQEILVERGSRCLWVDDYGRCTRYALDLVLNQNMSAAPQWYRQRATHTRLLLGPEYAILRPQFLDRGRTTGQVPLRADRVLVTLGGSDPPNATELVARALCQISDSSLEARLVIGPGNRRLNDLRARYSDPRLEWLDGTDDMPRLMDWAHMAVAAAGSTTYELCYLGVPSMLMILAENQREVCEAAAHRGVAGCLGWHYALNPESLAQRIEAVRMEPELRQRLADAARSAVDGGGPDRILSAMEHTPVEVPP